MVLVLYNISIILLYFCPRQSQSFPLCFKTLNIWICSDTDISLDPQVSFVPSVEVLVKALLMMSPAALKHTPDSFVRILLCSHHPCVVGSAKRDAVWKVAFLHTYVLSYIICT